MASRFGLSGFPLSEWNLNPSGFSLIVRIASCICARFILSDDGGYFPEQEEGSLDSRFQLPRNENVSVGLEDKKQVLESYHL
ncbi:uncharacterized protein Bfra_010075 [Botrytis fragariae]|uniref:Uncharacterized protein n=1 Tax=Botrytis fragariae TaxID=1964551 RepID=A0A8H6AMF1_9HELO|nr:uncharacterized protein Bfra_010075 [Botrytis fragariae]KAF5869930.1 hypothetical protein Bfra_010075 [Botrytis fragariae]